MEALNLDCTKIAWHQARLDQWKRGEHFAPITIDIALTRACDYKCVYCYSKLQENEGALNITRLRHFFEDAAYIGVKGISLVSDGESTLSPYFVQMIRYAHKLELSLGVGSHGLHLTKNKLGHILPCLDYLRFNISGGESRAYADIMGTREINFFKVVENIKHAVQIKREQALPVTLGMQMVLMPAYSGQVVPLANLAIKLGVDYLVIKHCSDDENGQLGVDYAKYASLYPTLEQAEALSTPQTQIIVKWSKIKAGTARTYKRCYGAPFLLQMSGSGLVAPCGCFFNPKYKNMHIGDIRTERLKDIVYSKKYWQVMNLLASKAFDAQTMCGCLCVQHKTCEALDAFRKKKTKLGLPEGKEPLHVNFI